MKFAFVSTHSNSSFWFSVIVFCVSLSAPKVIAAELLACDSAFHAVSPVSASSTLSTVNADAHARRQAKEYVEHWIELQTQNLAPNELSERLAEAQRLFGRISQGNPNFAKYVQDEFERVRMQMNSVPQNKSASREQRVRELREEIRSKIKSLRALKAEAKELSKWKYIRGYHDSAEVSAELDEKFRTAEGIEEVGTKLDVYSEDLIEVPGPGGTVRFIARFPGGHEGVVNGALLLPNSKILSWSYDHTLIIWTLRNGKYAVEQRLGIPENADARLGHVGILMGALVFPDGKILSWAWDYNLILWEPVADQYMMRQRLGQLRGTDPRFGHTTGVQRARVLTDWSILSSDVNRNVIEWAPTSLDSVSPEITRLTEELKTLRHSLSELRALEPQDTEAVE